MKQAVLYEGHGTGNGDEQQIEDEVCRPPRFEKGSAILGGDEKEHEDLKGDDQQVEDKVLPSHAFIEAEKYFLFIPVVLLKTQKMFQT